MIIFKFIFSLMKIAGEDKPEKQNEGGTDRRLFYVVEVARICLPCIKISLAFCNINTSLFVKNPPIIY